MATVAVLNVVIRATTEQLEAGLKKASSAIQRFAGGISSVVAKVTALGTAVVATGAAIFAAFVRRTQVTIESLAKMQQQTGINVESLNAMRFGAQRLGISVGTLQGSLTKFTRTLGQAAGGSTVAIDKFSALELSIDNLAGGGATEAFLQTIDAISKLGSAAEQSAAAQRIFGRSAAEILPLIQGGAAGITELRKTIADFGLELTQLDVTSIREMNNSIRELQLSFGGLVTRLTIELAPVISVVVERMIEWRRESANAGTIIERVVNLSVLGFIKVVNVIQNVIGAVKFVQAAFLEFLATVTSGLAIIVGVFSEDLAQSIDSFTEEFRRAANVLDKESKRAFTGINAANFLFKFNKEIDETRERFKELADEVERRSGKIAVIAPEGKAARGGRSRSFGIEAAERGSAKAIAVLERISGADREALVKAQLTEATKQTRLQQQHNDKLAQIQMTVKNLFPGINLQTAPF